MTATSPAVGISSILEAANIIGGASGWLSKVGAFGEEDGNMIVVKDSGGRSPEAPIAANYPTIQIMGRCKVYTVGYQKMFDIFNALHMIPQNPSAYLELVSCLVRGDIVPLGQDDKQRFQFSLNFNLITAPVDTGYRI